MHFYREYKRRLDEHIENYLYARHILFNAYDTYVRHEAAFQYGAREIALSLYTTIEIAQNCYEDYREMWQDPQLSQQERLMLEITFARFAHQCKVDHIDYVTPEAYIPITESYRPGDSYSDIDKAIEQLHLLEHYLNGISKMGYALYGNYVQIIIDRHGYAATMNFKDELRIDIDKILTHPQLITHIITHEIGHADDHAFQRTSSSQGDALTLEHLLPSSVQQVESQSDKNEVLADIFATFGSTVFHVPLDFVLSRARHLGQQTSPRNDGYRHFDYQFRAQMMQNVYSRLSQHFNFNQFGRKNRWMNFANHLRSKARITFTDLPTFEDIDRISNQFPFNKERQVHQLKIEYPDLFTPAYDGTSPPPVQVVESLDIKIANKDSKLSLKEIALNEATQKALLIDVDEYQKQHSPSPGTNMPSFLPWHHSPFVVPPTGTVGQIEWQRAPLPYDQLTPNAQTLDILSLNTTASNLILYKTLHHAARGLYHTLTKRWNKPLVSPKMGTDNSHLQEQPPEYSRHQLNGNRFLKEGASSSQSKRDTSEMTYKF